MSLKMLTLRKRNLACKSKMTIILSNDLRNQEREEKKLTETTEKKKCKYRKLNQNFVRLGNIDGEICFIRSPIGYI